MFYACMLFSPPQSWPLDSCSTTGPGCLRKTSATSRAAVGTARAPCQLKFPLGEGPFPQQDLHGFHMGLCPEVQLSCHSKTASRELATHVPTSCACPFPLMGDVSLSRKDGQSPEPLLRDLSRDITAKICVTPHLVNKYITGLLEPFWAVTCGARNVISNYPKLLCCLTYAVLFAQRLWQGGNQLIDWIFKE